MNAKFFRIFTPIAAVVFSALCGAMIHQAVAAFHGLSSILSIAIWGALLVGWVIALTNPHYRAICPRKD